MPRAPVHDHSDLQPDHASEDDDDAVDATMLPPG